MSATPFLVSIFTAVSLFLGWSLGKSVGMTTGFSRQGVGRLLVLMICSSFCVCFLGALAALQFEYREFSEGLDQVGVGGIFYAVTDWASMMTVAMGLVAFPTFQFLGRRKLKDL